MQDIRTLYHAEDQRTPDLGLLAEYGLCIDYVEPHTFKDQKRGYKRYQLSWGGPSEEFRMYSSPTVIEFWLMDWFDGAHITLDPDGEDAKIIRSIIQGA